MLQQIAVSPKHINPPSPRRAGPPANDEGYSRICEAASVLRISRLHFAVTIFAPCFLGNILSGAGGDAGADVLLCGTACVCLCVEICVLYSQR